MNPLDSVLNGWRKAFDAACAQVELHRVLGFPATVLPTHDALRRATLAALGARVPLEMRVAPHVESLRAKGVLAPGLHHAWNGENPELFTALIRASATGTPLPNELQPVTR